MKDNEINEFREKISQQEEIIQKLSKELADEKFINNKTKEYLFVIENRLSEKDKKIELQESIISGKDKKIGLQGSIISENDKKIKLQEKKIKKQNKKLKKLKKENQSLKNSTSWKITAPFRRIMYRIKN